MGSWWQHVIDGFLHNDGEVIPVIRGHILVSPEQGQRHLNKYQKTVGAELRLGTNFKLEVKERKRVRITPLHLCAQEDGAASQWN